ncbi:hypothetical protein WJ74_33825 [Burkholderia ubonensis]|nr:hypothetical protein WJ74_33825 [Burkholderia ubonensis]
MREQFFVAQAFAPGNTIAFPCPAAVGTNRQDAALANWASPPIDRIQIFIRILFVLCHLSLGGLGATPLGRHRPQRILSTDLAQTIGLSALEAIYFLCMGMSLRVMLAQVHVHPGDPRMKLARLSIRLPPNHIRRSQLLLPGLPTTRQPAGLFLETRAKHFRLQQGSMDQTERALGAPTSQCGELLQLSCRFHRVAPR